MAIVKRIEKGSALTHAEMDGNFTDLDTRISNIEGANDSDNQTLNLVGNILQISGGNSVDLSTLQNPVDSLADISVAVAAPGNSNLTYTSQTGEFVFTPPDLSSYLTSYTVTQADVTTHQAALSITESQITDLAHYDDTALAARVTTLENAGFITSETDSQALSLVGTDLSITNGNTVDLSGFLTSYTETDPVVGAITGIVKADGAGNISAAVAGTDYLTSVAFADLTATPTTIAGYGITDAFDGTYASLSGSPTDLVTTTMTSAIDANSFDISNLFAITLQTQTSAVIGATEGTVVIADGVNWNPLGNGRKSMVVYLGGDWREIAAVPGV